MKIFLSKSGERQSFSQHLALVIAELLQIPEVALPSGILFVLKPFSLRAFRTTTKSMGFNSHCASFLPKSILSLIQSVFSIVLPAIGDNGHQTNSI